MKLFDKAHLSTLMKLVNAWLIIAFPVSWFAPLLKAGLLPFFNMTEISILSGLTALMESDIFLAGVVALFAIILPLAKVMATAAIQFGFLKYHHLWWVSLLGKFAMAEVFLLALYIVVAKGVGVGRLETAWGLYFFTFCVLMSYLVTVIETYGRKAPK